MMTSVPHKSVQHSLAFSFRLPAPQHFSFLVSLCYFGSGVLPETLFKL